MAKLYTILEIPETATAEDIKKAYRKLAKKYHPDLNPNDERVKKKFQEITHAYEILSNVEKRGQYDRGEIDEQGNPQMPQVFYDGFRSSSSSSFHDAGHFGGDSFSAEDLFSSIFGQRGSGRHRQQKGSDVHYTLKISFVEAALGAKKTITLADHKSVDLTIPAGIVQGSKLRLQGKGNAGIGGGPAGDAFVEIHVATHPQFKREGHNIVLNLPISLPEAILGASIKVPTLHGMVSMKIPAGTSSGKVLRLKERGLSYQGKKGDQLITLHIQLPQTLDKDLQKFMEKWGHEHPYKVRE